VKVSADPVDFAEAVAHFTRRVPMLKSDWLELARRAQRRAFTIAGVAQLDLIAYVHEQIKGALTKGTPFEDFKRSIRDALRAAWTMEDAPKGAPADTPDAHAARIELIFRNACNGSFNSGRWLQAKHPETVKVRPYWLFDGIVDSRQSEICAECDGTVLPADDPWWSTHVPPLHHNCRSGFVTLTEKQAIREGVSKVPPEQEAAPGFGLEPSKSEWSPKWTRYPSKNETIAKKAIAAASSAKPIPPPVPLSSGPFTIGKHVLEVKKIPAEELAALTKDLGPSTLAYLEGDPLEVLERSSSKIKAAGRYRVKARGIELFSKALGENAKAHPTASSEPYGRVFSVADRFPPAERERITFLHELGHHLGISGSPSWRKKLVEAGVSQPWRDTKIGAEVDLAIARAWKSLKLSWAGSFDPKRKGIPSISRYAFTTKDEYFAESYAAYVVDPAGLLAHDEIGYELVVKVLKLRGIL